MISRRLFKQFSFKNNKLPTFQSKYYMNFFKKEKEVELPESL